jgi:hypothetical protein
VAVLLDTLPTPSTDRVDKVYRQLKDFLIITAMQQEESSLQRWAKVSISSLGRSKATREKAAIELPMAATASLPAQILARARPCHPNRHPEPLTCRQARQGDDGA